jgi:hypothetical protein
MVKIMRGLGWLFAGLTAVAAAAIQAPDPLGVAAVDSYVAPTGAFVNMVTPGSPASVAGLVPGDVITSCDGRAITTARQLQGCVAAHRPGDVVSLRVVKIVDHSSTDIRVTLGGTPAPAKAADAAAPAAAPANAPAGKRPDVQWVRFTDPVEHAFAIDVPAGWSVTGGSRRMSAVEIRTGVTAVSPDGAITLFYGDLDVPIFTVPTQMMAMGGLREGMIYSPGQGVQMRIMRYQPGQAFAAQWGAERVGRACASVTRTSSNARPDSSSAFDQAYAMGGVRASILAGEASFSCTLGGAPAAGYVFAATELVQSQASALWDVKSLVGFTAPMSRAVGAYGVLTHMVASFVIDRDWEVRQQAITKQFDRIVSESNAAVSRAIIANGQALSAASDRIFQAGQQRSRDTMSAIDKYDEYAVRGTSDYVNPATGTRYSFLDNSYAHTYVSADQRILQTDSANPPGPGWTEIKAASGGRR